MTIELPFLYLYCYHERVTQISAGSVTFVNGNNQAFST